MLFDDKKQRLPPADLSPGANIHSNDGCSYMTGWMEELGRRKCVDGRVPLPGEDKAAVVRLDGQFEILGEKDYFTPAGWDGGEVCAPNGEELSRLWTANLDVRSVSLDVRQVDSRNIITLSSITCMRAKAFSCQREKVPRP